MEQLVLEFECSFFNPDLFEFSEDEKKFPKSFVCDEGKMEKVSFFLFDSNFLYL